MTIRLAYSRLAAASAGWAVMLSKLYPEVHPKEGIKTPPPLDPLKKISLSAWASRMQVRIRPMLRFC